MISFGYKIGAGWEEAAGDLPSVSVAREGSRALWLRSVGPPGVEAGGVDAVSAQWGRFNSSLCRRRRHYFSC